MSLRAALALLVITARQIAGFYRIRRAPSLEALLAENETKLLERSARGETGAAETAIKHKSTRRVSNGQATSADRYGVAGSPQVHPVEAEVEMHEA